MSADGYCADCGEPLNEGDTHECRAKLFATSVGPDKRIILEYVNGDWAGQYQIVGLVSGTPPSHISGPFQCGVGPIVEFASRIRVGYRYVHYREVMDRSKFAGRLGDYMPGNRTGDFDPRQS